MSSVSSMRGRMAGASVYSSQGCFPASVVFMSMLACSTTSRPARATPACPTVITFTIFWLVEEEKVTRNSYSGRRIHREPPCVTPGAGTRPEGIAPSETLPLAKFSQQELPYRQGRWLVDPQGSSRLEVYAWTIQLLGQADCMHG